MGKIDVTLARSTIGRPERQNKVVRGLGLRRLNQTVRHEDNPCIRGMIEKVSHLLRVETVEDE